MPKKKAEKVHLTITVDVDLNEWLEKTAVELRMNKSQFINNVISLGMDDVKLLKATGLLKLADVARKLKEGGLTLKPARGESG